MLLVSLISTIVMADLKDFSDDECFASSNLSGTVNREQKYLNFTESSTHWNVIGSKLKFSKSLMIKLIDESSISPTAITVLTPFYDSGSLSALMTFPVEVRRNDINPLILQNCYVKAITSNNTKDDIQKSIDMYKRYIQEQSNYKLP